MDSQAGIIDPTRQDKIDPINQRITWLSTPHVFAVITIALLSKFDWAVHWLISGAPILTYSILLGASQGSRFLPYIPLWSLFSTLHLIYCIAATSWLLYWLFAATCYPLLLLSCLFQFDFLGRFLRRRLRTILVGSQFVNDKIALFNLPALEIDTEVDGLFVIRAVTISLSSLKIVAHGVEVGIKLNQDMELAISTDKVTVHLFRSIEIDHVFANIKGITDEMTFGDFVGGSPDQEDPGQSSLLRAATLSAQDLITPVVEKTQEASLEPSFKLARKPVPVPSSPKALETVLESVQTVSDDNAEEQYNAALRRIHESSLVTKSRSKINMQIGELEVSGRVHKDSGFDRKNDKHIRAAVCARLHNKSSIPHPPQNSIAVTTLRNQSSPATRRFLHRLPMLLRLLLNPLSYFHPIKIASLTAGGSGKWIEHILSTFVFQHYSEKNADIRRLEKRVNTWLADANFVLQLESISAVAHVPFITTYDIEARLAVEDLIIYRVLQGGGSLVQAIRLCGANASVNIPSFLLPHHEHLFPPVPSEDDVHAKEKQVDEADGLPKTIEANVELLQTIKDEVNIGISARARLPAVLDQQLLDFIAALVKATKFIEIEKSIEDRLAEDTTSTLMSDTASEDGDAESITSVASASSLTSPTSPRWSDFKVSVKALNKKAATGVEKTWKRGILGGAVNDRWIAKLVGKVTKLLETVRGDLGYSGEIPVPLEPYRMKAETKSKILA